MSRPEWWLRDVARGVFAIQGIDIEPNEIKDEVLVHLDDYLEIQYDIGHEDGLYEAEGE